MIRAIESQSVALINDAGVNGPGWKDVGFEKGRETAARYTGRCTVSARHFLAYDRYALGGDGLSTGVMIDGKEGKVTKGKRRKEEARGDFRSSHRVGIPAAIDYAKRKITIL